MSRRLRRLWSALERVPDLAAVPREWRSLLGGDHDAVARLLLPTRRIAGAVKSTVSGRTCIHEIRKFKGEYLEVCPDGCKTATRSRDEVTVHRLDVAGFAREIAESLGLEALPVEAVPNVAGAWKIGDCAPFAKYRFPVCLTFVGEPDILRSVVDGLAARGEPFILVAPTRSAFGQAAADLLKRTDSLFLALDELVGDGDGRLSLLDGHTAASVFAEFYAAHVPQPKAHDGTAFFPTPPGVQWTDLAIVFKDAHTVSVSLGGIQRVLNYTAMGMANRKTGNPNKQWELLYGLALRNDLIRQSRKARPKFVGLEELTNERASNKQRGNRRDAQRKQKQLLAEALRKFFQIDGDPFILTGNGGWSTRFSLTAEEGSL
jgi:hypothetical protein